MTENVPFNFGGLADQTFKNAKIIVLPVPYDVTASYVKGTQDGPNAIIEASRNMELYDIETDSVPSDNGIFTMPQLDIRKDEPNVMLDKVREATLKILDADKFPVIIGGEHSISPGVVSAMQKKFPHLSVLQIDAHSDLRDEYEETKHSHACAMKRIREICKDVAQVGIRSMCDEEADFIKKDEVRGIFYAPDVPISDILNCLTDDVYITFDIDGLDPSIMPSTGTPEPGGLGWYQTLELLKEVFKKKNVVGFDVNEFSPIKGIVAPDFLVSKLIYKMLAYKFKEN